MATPAFPMTATSESSGHFIHHMPFGAEPQRDGTVRFRVWAPEAASLDLIIEGLAAPLPMRSEAAGWFEVTTAAACAGSLYRFLLPNGLMVPDPVSRFQPRNVDGPSMVMDPSAYFWRTPNWKGRPWDEAILYELHIGTFTPKGTFSAALEKLDYLVDLGITAIEIMSLGDFPGAWNWGYDGVLPYAPDSSYGHPDDLKNLIDAAHERGLMVLLDVVYNHFGPEGNYIPQYFPDICTDRYATPWGQALNFDSRHGDRTREFILHNALYWIEEFRMDGLRLDAVHAIIDASSTHILDELSHQVRAVAGNRHVHIVLESDDTMWNRLIRDEASSPLLSTAQWNHDCKQLLVLGLSTGRSVEQDLADTGLLGRALVEGFTSNPPRLLPAQEGSLARTLPVLPHHLPPDGFIAFVQTHDLVGNRIRGERISHLSSAATLRALAAIYLLSPQIPMLFMGEEWAASSPFPYFCDFRGDLAEAIRNGRLEQFTTPAERADNAFVATIPDPLAETTFRSAKLQWDEIGAEPHAEWLSFYRQILQTRQQSLVPLLTRIAEGAGSYTVVGPRCLEVRWTLDRGELCLQANLAGIPSPSFKALEGETIWQEGSILSATELGPWSVRWSISAGSAGESV